MRKKKNRRKGPIESQIQTKALATRLQDSNFNVRGHVWRPTNTERSVGAMCWQLSIYIT